MLAVHFIMLPPLIAPVPNLYSRSSSSDGILTTRTPDAVRLTTKTKTKTRQFRLSMDVHDPSHSGAHALYLLWGFVSLRWTKYPNVEQ